MLLQLISWPYTKKHLVRSLLTTLGIILGVAVFVGMHTASRSVLIAFRQTVGKIAGSTQLQVTAGDAGFAEEVLERVQAVPEVRAASPVVEASVETGLAGQGSLLIFAVDMTGDRALRDYDVESGDDSIPDPLIFLAQADSIMVGRPFADRNKFGIGSRLKMETMEGPREFVIRGIMKGDGLASGYGGNIAVMDIYAAQKVLGRGQRFDRIDLAVREDAGIDETQQKLQTLLGPGFSVDPPSARGAQFESLLRVFSITFTITSLFAMLIGVFLIYNSFSIAVTQRRGEIGILRALGATRTQVRRLFLSEGFIGGVVGSAVGLVFGLLGARAIAGTISGLIAVVYGASGKSDSLELDRVLLAGAFCFGVLASVLGAYLPARDAARVDPVKALQKGRTQILSAGESMWRRRAALTLILVGVVCHFIKGAPVFYAGYFAITIATLLLVPAASAWLARGLRPLLKWVSPVEGALAADSVIQAPRRTSATVTALMLSLSMALSVAGLTQASYSSILEWMDTSLNPDLFVTTSQNFAVRTFTFPYSMREELEAIDGMRAVQPVRLGRVTVGNSPVLLVAGDLRSIARTTRGRTMIAGSYDDAHERAARGEGVVVSENFANLAKSELGDVVEIPSPEGMLKLPVLGIVRDYSDQQGSIFMDLSVYQRIWKDMSVDIFRVYLKPGASQEAVKTEVLRKFSSQRRVFVLFNRDMKDYILKVTDQWFGMTTVQTAVAVLVAILGIVNSLTVSINDRKRELGVMRAVGGLRMQIRRTIWLEALAIAAIGLILGVASGLAQQYYQLIMIARDISGIAVDFVFPWKVFGVIVPVIFGSAYLAALAPAEAAVRSSLVEALEYE